MSKAGTISCRGLLAADKTNIPIEVQNAILEGDLLRMAGERVQNLVSQYPSEKHFIVGWGRTTTLEAALMNLELGEKFDLAYRQINASLSSTGISSQFINLFLDYASSSRKLVVTRNLIGGMTWPRLIPRLIAKLRESDRHEMVMDFTIDGPSAFSWADVSPQKFIDEQAEDVLHHLKKFNLKSVNIAFKFYSKGKLVYKKEVNSGPSETQSFNLAVKVDLDNDYNDSTTGMSNLLEPYATSRLFKPFEIESLGVQEVINPRSEFFDLVQLLRDHISE